ncbi:MAG: efflux transporter outer membrane subunit [Oceanospirillales bacterium]|nr:efflux transporter outer membrane subunit [Oceanospirillales bacterium]
MLSILPSPSHSSRQLLLLAMVVLLPGCAMLGPDFTAPEQEAPADWSAWHSGPERASAPGIDTDTQPAEKWWLEFDDPVLNQLQQRLAEASPDLRSAVLNFAGARLQRQIVASERGVDVQASGGVSRQKLSEYGTSMRMAAISSPANSDALIGALAEPFTLYQAGFDASWEPDFWGRIGRSIEAAEAGSTASAALLDHTRLGLSAELARAYFELRSLQQQVRLMQRDIGLKEDQLALLEANRAAGLVSDVQVDSLRMQLSEQRAGLPALNTGVVASMNAISTLLGEHPGALDALLQSDAVDTFDSIHSADLALGVPSSLARRRPDIRAAEAQLHAATAEIGVATADLYPRVTLHAGFGVESFLQSAFGKGGSEYWSIGPGFYLPIFNQGRLKARVELTKMDQQQAAVHYRQTVLRAWQEIDNALTAYAAEQTRYHQLQQKLASARSQLEINRANRAAGLSDSSAEIASESLMLGVERQLVDSRATMNIQRVAVYKAVGGGVDSAGVTE